MLSRLAESYFWLGRYLERAEATTRLLAEHHQLMVEDQSVSETLACAVLLEALEAERNARRMLE
ncbi:MAG: alpha-E domain-containing protein, partial [Candidatus Nanopelagicales bacterium]